MIEIGAYEQANPPTLFAIEVRLPAADLQEHWRRCNMLANYVAEYAAYQFAEREWAENLISTVANEFLEAVVRLSPADAELTLRCAQAPDSLLVELLHGVRPEVHAPYGELLRALGGGGVDALYFELLSAARPSLDFNQLGLAMVAHDFRAAIAARLDAREGRASVRVRVPTADITA